MGYGVCRTWSEIAETRLGSEIAMYMLNKASREHRM
jgi:hypothetical protein